EQSLELVQSESLLSILLGGWLSDDTKVRISQVLERWATQAMAAGTDEMELKKTIRPGSWREFLGLREPVHIGLARQFKKTPLSRELLREFCGAFTPKPEDSGESVREDARRNGDLMPGEGNPSPIPLQI